MTDTNTVTGPEMKAVMQRLGLSAQRFADLLEKYAPAARIKTAKAVYTHWNRRSAVPVLLVIALERICEGRFESILEDVRKEREQKRRSN